MFNKRSAKGVSPLTTEKSDPAALSVIPETGAKFEVTVDPAFFGLANDNPLTVSSRVSRRAALQVPAVKRGRDLVCGTIGTLPLCTYNSALERIPSDLLTQPELGVPVSVSITRIAEDLVFEGVAWWKVTGYDWRGFPSRVVRLEPRSISVDKQGRVVWTREGNYGEESFYIEDRELIRFDSPNDPLLIAGARAISTALRLDAAASRFSEGVPPMDFFTPKEGADPTAEEVAQFLADWKVARQTRGTGFVSAPVEYHTNSGWSPEQLQMAEARSFAITEIARLMGVDPEDLGVSTTSRTYQNAQDRYQARVKDTLRPYLAAIEQRLSFNDVTPRGYVVRFDLSDLLRSDDASRYAAYLSGLQSGALTRDEIREAEHKQPLSPEEAAEIPALPSAPSEVPSA